MSTAPKPWTHWLLKLQGLLILLLLFGVCATRFQLAPFRVAFGSFGLALLGASVVGFAAALVLIWSWFKPARQHRAYAGVSAVIGVVPVLAVLSMVGPGRLGSPPIHDITTDTHNPPQFVAARRERGEGENSLDYSQGVASIQERAYPNIKPLLSHRDYIEAYKHSLAMVKKLGWRVLREDMEAGIIEAVDTSSVFGFKDDVVIRVSVDGEGSRVDMRSVSRVGVSDLGANAARIARFQGAFNGGAGH